MKLLTTFFNMKILTAALTVWMRVNYFMLYYQQQSSQLSVDVRLCVELKHDHLQTKVCLSSLCLL